MWRHGVTVICTPAKAKWSHGKAESAIRTTKGFIRRAAETVPPDEPCTFAELLDEATKARNLATDASGFAPYYKLYGIMPRLAGETPEEVRSERSSGQNLSPAFVFNAYDVFTGLWP